MTNKKSMKFEEAMDRLEKVIGVLQEGNISLDESLSYFEEGIALVKLCQKKLQDTESRITMLVKDANGDVEEFPFNVEMEE